MTAWSNPNDTPEMTALIARAEEIATEKIKLRTQERQVEEKLDKLRLAARPTYPTQEQIDGLVEATRRMSERIKPWSHHGDPTPTYMVVVDGEGRWLHIRDGAPYSAARGGKLWEFTAEEIETFLDILKGEGHCWRIESHWRSDGGLSVRVST